MRGAVLLLAAGSGARLAADVPKAFVEIGGVTLLRRAASAVSAATLVDLMVVAAPSTELDRARDEASAVFDGELRVVAGGDVRQTSASSALGVAGDVEAVLVHDAARPFVPPFLFDACLRELDGCEAVCTAVPLTDTVKEISEARVVRTLDRSTLVAAQTPQGFRTEVYRRAHEAASRDGFVGTDDAALVERIGVGVNLVPGDDRNLKITTRRDLELAERMFV